MPGSAHSGSAIWDDCGRVFPDELRVSLFPDSSVIVVKEKMCSSFIIVIIDFTYILVVILFIRLMCVWLKGFQNHLVKGFGVYILTEWLKLRWMCCTNSFVCLDINPVYIKPGAVNFSQRVPNQTFPWRYVLLYMYVYVCAHVCVCMCARVCVCMCVCVCVCVRWLQMWEGHLSHFNTLSIVHHVSKPRGQGITILPNRMQLIGPEGQGSKSRLIMKICLKGVQNDLGELEVVCLYALSIHNASFFELFSISMHWIFTLLC